MSKVKVTHKFPRKSASNVEAVFLFLLLVGGGTVVRFMNVGFDGVPYYIVLALGFILTFILVRTDFKRRHNSQLFAEFDTDDTKVHVWMNKGTAAWKGRLSVLGNEIDLKNVGHVSLEDINFNRTLILTEKDSNKRMYIPQRVALQPEFKDFVLNFIEKNKENMTQNQIIVMTKFFNGDNGIIEKPLKEDRKEKPKTIAELMEQEKESE